jgi:hypothetical protein
VGWYGAALAPLGYSIFDSGVYRNPDLYWLFPQEKATLQDLQISTSESKILDTMRESAFAK